MKKLNLAIAIFATTMVLFSSCKKDALVSDETNMAGKATTTTEQVNVTHATVEPQKEAKTNLLARQQTTADTTPVKLDKQGILRKLDSKALSLDTRSVTYLFDNFEHYYLGNLSYQAEHWVKMNPGSFDATVGTSGGNKYMKMDNQYGYGNDYQPSTLFHTGSKHSGRYQLDMDLWIYHGNTALMYTQNAYLDNSARIYFGPNGVGYVSNTDGVRTFTFTHNKWMDVKLYIDITNNAIYLYIDGVYKTSWNCNDRTSYTEISNKSFRGVQFTSAYYSSSLFYMDNVYFRPY